MDAGDEDRSRLLAFFALAFAWSWTCWLLAPVIKAQSALAAGVLSALGGFGPGVAAMAVVRHSGGRAALRAWLGRCLQWRIGWRWYALAFFLPLALSVLAAAMHAALGGTPRASPVAGHLPLAAANLVLILLLAIGLQAWPDRRARAGLQTPRTDWLSGWRCTFGWLRAGCGPRSGPCPAGSDGRPPRTVCGIVNTIRDLGQRARIEGYRARLH